MVKNDITAEGRIRVSNDSHKPSSPRVDDTLDLVFDAHEPVIMGQREKLDAIGVRQSLKQNFALE